MSGEALDKLIGSLVNKSHLQTAMEVDAPLNSQNLTGGSTQTGIGSNTVSQTVSSATSGTGITLKRCSSAPMINENVGDCSVSNRTTSSDDSGVKIGTSVVSSSGLGAGDGVTGMSTTPPLNVGSREPQIFSLFGSSHPSRPRRFSASFSPISGSPVSGCTGLRLTPRINQLRQEECADVSNSRELAHEREVHHTMQISQSWEDLRIIGQENNTSNQLQQSPRSNIISSSGSNSFGSSVTTSSNNNNNNNASNNKMSPLSVTLPPYSFHCNSPSPTRHSSPLGFQSPTRSSCSGLSNMGLWTPTSSSTRTSTFVRRSASPVLRPSALSSANSSGSGTITISGGGTISCGSAKRKLDEMIITDIGCDQTMAISFNDRLMMSSPRAKRTMSTSSFSGGMAGLLTTTPATPTNASCVSSSASILAASTITSSVNVTTPSPLPGSLSSGIGTPESISSADSPGGFQFRMIDSPSPGRPHHNIGSPMACSSTTSKDQEMTESSS